jgi:hypothetical protein
MICRNTILKTSNIGQRSTSSLIVPCKLIIITQRASLSFIPSRSDKFHVCVNDTINDDVPRFPITTPGLHFHNTTDTLRYLTTGSEVGLSQAVQKTRWADQSADKTTGESYHPPSALIHRITI